MPVLSADRFGASGGPKAKRKPHDRAADTPTERRHNRHVGPWAKVHTATDPPVQLAWQNRRLESTKASAPPPPPPAPRRRTHPEEEDMHDIIETYTKMVLERTECIHELAQKRQLPHSKKRPPSAQQRVYMPTSRIRRAVQSAGAQRPASAHPSLVRIRVLNTVPNAAPSPADVAPRKLAPAIDKAATTSLRNGARVLPPRCMSATPRRKPDAAAPRPHSALPRSSMTPAVNRPTVEMAENGKMKLTVHMTHVRMENNDNANDVDGDDDDDDSGDD